MADRDAGEDGYRRQHLFTSSVLDRWCDTQPGEPRCVLEITRSDAERATTMRPRRAGYVIDFIDQDRQRFEETWSKVEGDAIVSLRALDGLQHAAPNQAARTTIVDLVALHVVRGYGAKTYWEASHRKQWPRRLASLADLPAVQEAASIIGMEPLAYATELAKSWEDPLRHAGTAFGEVLIEVLAGVTSTLRTWDFELIRSPDRDIVAPDVAAVTIDDQSDRIGVLGGVGLHKASRLIMPVGPEQIVVLRPQPPTRRNGPLDASEADGINRLLARAAIERVWIRPGAAVHADLVETWRHQIDPPFRFSPA
jgi:hypothetical protein